MKNIKTTLLGVMMVVIAMPVIAQEIPMNKQERFNAQRIAFFTERLRLTSEEAQVFWPIYNDYQDQKNKIIENRKELTRTMTQNQRTLTDNDIEKLGDEYVASVVEEAELLQIYHARFKEVLPIRKVMRIYSTEIQFKNFLLRQIQQSQTRGPQARMQ